MTLECGLKGTQKLFFLNQGQAASCCRSYPESLPPTLDRLLQHWQQEKQQLADGVAITNCETCWKHESAGLKSYRNNYGMYTINTVELWLSNACNQMCSYCSPKFSSTWQDSIEHHGAFTKVSATAHSNQAIPIKSNIDTNYWIDQITDYIKSQPADSVNLRLLGGEPLMQLKNLEKIISVAGHGVRKLIINTNLNPPNNKFLSMLLNTVPAHKLEFSVSLDATPEYNHVPRAGFDQARFKSNLALLQHSQVGFKFSSVVSVLGIFDLPNFVAWGKSNQYTMNFLKINAPDCLDPIWLPSHVVDQIAQEFGDVDPPEIFKELHQNPQKMVDLKSFEQYNYLSQYFSRTGIVPADINNVIFQDYWSWISKKFIK